MRGLGTGWPHGPERRGHILPSPQGRLLDPAQSRTRGFTSGRSFRSLPVTSLGAHPGRRAEPRGQDWGRHSREGGGAQRRTPGLLPRVRSGRSRQHAGAGSWGDSGPLVLMGSPHQGASRVAVWKGPGGGLRRRTWRESQPGPGGGGGPGMGAPGQWCGLDWTRSSGRARSQRQGWTGREDTAQ